MLYYNGKHENKVNKFRRWVIESCFGLCCVQGIINWILGIGIKGKYLSNNMIFMLSKDSMDKNENKDKGFYW